MNKPSVILNNKYIHNKLLSNQLSLFPSSEINSTGITNSQIKKFIKEINKTKLPISKISYISFDTLDSNIFYTIKIHKEKNLIIFKDNYKFKFILNLDKNLDYLCALIYKLHTLCNMAYKKKYFYKVLSENDCILVSSLIFYLVNLYTKSYLVTIDKSTYTSCFYHKAEVQEFKNSEDILYKFYETIKN